MKALLAAFAILLATPSLGHARIVTLGAQVGFPDTFGLHFSLWPIDTLTLDAQATMASVDGGLTGHFDLGAGNAHHALVTAMGGYYTWHWDYIAAHGTRITLQAGYGYEAAQWELRALMGANFIPGWGFAPAGTLMFGVLL